MVVSLNEELGILISGKIDTNKTVKQINTDLKNIQKQIDGLDLNIDTSKMTKEIQKLNQNMQKQLGNLGQGTGNVGKQITDSVSIDMNQLRKNHAEVFAEIDKLQKHYGGTIQSIQRQGGLDLTDTKEPERLNRVNVALKDLNGTIRNFEILNEEDGLNIVGFNETANIEKARKETERLTEAMARGREQSLERQRKEQEKLAQNQAKHVNKAINDSYKEAQAEKEKTEQLEHQLHLAQRQAQIKVQDLRRRYKPVLTREDNEALDRYVNSMNRLNTATPNVSRQIQVLNTDFREISASVAEAGSRTDGLIKQLGVAMQRINKVVPYIGDGIWKIR